MIYYVSRSTANSNHASRSSARPLRAQISDVHITVPKKFEQGYNEFNGVKYGSGTLGAA